MFKKLFACLLLACGTLTPGCMQQDDDPSRPHYSDSGDSAIDTGDTGDSGNGDSGDSAVDTDDTGDSGNGDSGDSSAGTCVPSGEIVKSLEDPEIVIYMVSDTLRADTAQEDMPFLSSLASQGIRFWDFFGAANWTRTANIGMATGTLWAELGPNTAADDSVSQIPVNIPTLTERFAEAGWYTISDICNGVANDSEAPRGSDELVVCVNPENNNTTAIQQFQRVTERIKELRNQGITHIFVWIYFMEPHAPYNRPATTCTDKEGLLELEQSCPGWQSNNGTEMNNVWWDQNNPTIDAACTEAVRAAYRCDSLQLDYDIRDGFALLDEEGLLNNAVVLFTADHGEYTVDHDPKLIGHKKWVHSQLTRLPMFMWWKGVSPATSCDISGHADIAPTLLDLAGIPVNDDVMSGESLFEVANMTSVEKDARIAWQLACDAGGIDVGAVYKMDGSAFHTMFRYRNGDSGAVEELWYTFSVDNDPYESTPLGIEVPEHIRDELIGWRDTVNTWDCN